MPTTSLPSDFNNAAVAEESTPPDMATTILVSCGRPSRPRLLRPTLLSMVPVIDAIAAASNALRLESCCGWRPWSVFRESKFAPGKAEKLPFNIGGIPVKQSRQPLCAPQTANLAAGQKRRSLARPPGPPCDHVSI